MKTTTFLKHAEREAQFIDALLARYALTVHHGMTVLGDDEYSSPWPLNFSKELGRIDAVLQMAGIDTTQALHPPVGLSPDDDNAPHLGD
jgi:hypothetical protein